MNRIDELEYRIEGIAIHKNVTDLQSLSHALVDVTNFVILRQEIPYNGDIS